MKFNLYYRIKADCQAREGFFTDGGRIRGVPVKIGGNTYNPPIPEEYVPEFKHKLVAFYEGENIEVISEFLK